MTVRRSVEIHLDPAELAELFCNLCGDEQAEFFAAVGRLAASWPNSGWCGQSYDIIKHLGPTGRATIATLAAHLDPEPSEWIDWAGGKCPVLDCVRVDVRFRNGRQADNHDPVGWNWRHNDFPSDIIAYRLSDAPA